MRFPHILVELGKLKICRKDTDDLRRDTVELDRRAYRILRAPKTTLPEVIANQGEMLPLGGLPGGEDAPLNGLNAQQCEKVG